MPQGKKTKFADLVFSLDAVEQWTPDLEVSSQGVRSIRGEFATYWKQGKIAREVETHICRCWFLREAGDLAAYITLGICFIKHQDFPHLDPFSLTQRHN